MGSSNSILYRIANLFNTISLAASIVLLVGISFEVTGGEKSGFADWYRTLQLIVCSIFFATALFRLMIAQYRHKHWLRDLLFAVASIPYMDILEWSGANLEHSSVRILAFAPVLISIMATVVILEWLIEGKKRRLMAAYVLTVTMFTYISALLFYDCEMGVNSHLKTFGDALWWAWMNVTTVGAAIFPVTTVGKVVCVLLPIVGMMFFPIFTVYVSDYYDRKESE
ncbi:MAG: two pore domain potassium channel family protein [Rikenellaceae bacterium]|nr:two pore domain potassium channel family protein [Rikenellaceae bacterium]